MASTVDATSSQLLSSYPSASSTTRFASHSASLPIANAAVCPLNTNVNPVVWDNGKKRKADHADMLQVVLKMNIFSLIFFLSFSVFDLLPPKKTKKKSNLIKTVSV